jgi:hypothetical protein
MRSDLGYLQHHADAPRQEDGQEPCSQEAEGHSPEGREPTESNAERYEAVESPASDATDNASGTVVAGRPDEMSWYWQDQGATRDCALYAEGSAARAFGREFDVERERKAAADAGEYDGSGTSREAMGHVWERNGLAVERYATDPEQPPEAQSDAAWTEMARRLDEGKAVVVAVDTGPIWENWEHAADRRGHALWVTGIKELPEGSYGVVCNDSGRPDGKGMVYPAEDFERAWRGYEYQMVSTREAIPVQEAES